MSAYLETLDLDVWPDDREVEVTARDLVAEHGLDHATVLDEPTASGRWVRFQGRRIELLDPVETRWGHGAREDAAWELETAEAESRPARLDHLED